MDEIFKEIPGSGGRYKVSNLGRVYNVKKQKIQTFILSRAGDISQWGCISTILITYPREYGQCLNTSIVKRQ